MKKIRRAINRVMYILAGSSFLAMVVLTCWQVLTRYVLKNPSSWTEELVSFLFAWMSLFGASIMVGERGHMNIPILPDHVSKEVRSALEIFAELIIILFSTVVLVYGGIRISGLAMGQLTSSLGILAGYFYLVLPLSGILNVVYSVLNLIDIIRIKKEEMEV